MTISHLSELAYLSAKKRGLVTDTTPAIEFVNKLYEELSELEAALEIGAQDEHLPQYKAACVELADVILTALCFARQQGIAIEPILEAKNEYNWRR